METPELKKCLDCKITINGDNTKKNRKSCKDCIDKKTNLKKPRDGALKCGRCLYYIDECQFKEVRTFRSCNLCREKARINTAPREHKESDNTPNHTQEEADQLYKLFIYLKTKYNITEELHNILETLNT